MANNIKRNLGIVLPFTFLIVLVVLFSVINGSSFFNIHNLKTIINRMIPLAIGGYGLLFVISQGSIDISTGANLAFSAILAAIISSKIGLFALFPLCVIIGALVGLVNGILVSKFKIPSVMATIAHLIILGSFVVLLTHGRVIPVDRSILKLNKVEIRFLIFLVITAIAVYIFEYTKIGYSSTFVGENEVACKYAGLKTRRIKTLAFVLCGAFVGVASFLTIPQVGGVTSQMGSSYELQIMMAVYVGGVPVQGGSKSSVIKVIIGALLMSILKSGLSITKIGTAMEGLIQGILLLAVVSILLIADRKIVAEDAKVLD